MKSMRRFLFTAKRQLAKRQGLWSLGANGFSALTGLLIFALSTKRLTSTEFGAWVLFQAMATLFDMLRTGLILPGFLKQAAGRSIAQKNVIHQTASILYGSFGVVQIVICMLLALVTDAQSSLHFFFANYPLVMITGTMVTLAEWKMQANHRFHQILFLRVINRLPLLVFCYFFLESNVDIVYAQAISNCLSWFCLGFVGLPLFPKVSQATIFTLRKLLTFGKYATPAQIASTLLRSSDTFMISSFLGIAATGIYGAAARFLEFFELPIRSAASVHFNRLAALINAGKKEEGIKFTIQKIIKTTMLVMPLSLLLIVFAPQIIRFISGDQYLGSVSILRMMAVYCLFIPADRYLGLFLEALGKPELNLIKVVAMLLLNVLTNLVALLIFESAFAVAVTSVLTFVVGIILGSWLIMAKGLNDSKETINMKAIVLANP